MRETGTGGPLRAMPKIKATPKLSDCCVSTERRVHNDPKAPRRLRRRADVDGANRLVRMEIITYDVLGRMPSERPHVDGKAWA